MQLGPHMEFGTLTLQTLWAGNFAPLQLGKLLILSVGCFSDTLTSKSWLHYYISKLNILVYCLLIDSIKKLGQDITNPGGPGTMCPPPVQ